MTLQERIDSKAYPPTHQYNVASLTPRGILADRVAIMDRLCPDFWKGKRLLDIGANKGYFAARGKRAGMDVTALDPDPESTEICEDLGVKAVTASFRDTGLYGQFDRVFLGNGHHYLFVEAGGWEFFDKIAALMAAGGLLVIEGMAEGCADLEVINPRMPLAIRPKYKKDLLLQAAAKHFKLTGNAPATHYTPEREVFVFKRLPRVPEVLWNPSIGSDAQYVEGPSLTGYTVKYKSASAYLKLVPGESPSWLERSVRIASLVPGSSPVGCIFRDEAGVFRGWSEKIVEGKEVARFDQAGFAAWRERNAYLAKLGYVDLDCGTPNFIRTSSGLVHVDKNATFPIAEITEDVAAWPTGRIWQVHRLWYHDNDLCPVIAAALLSKNAALVEQAFRLESQ